MPWVLFTRSKRLPIYFLTMDGLLKLAFRLAFITVLQFLEELPDRQAADAVRGRIDWKYLLGLALDDPGFDFTVRISIFGHAWCEGKQSRSCWTLCWRSSKSRGGSKSGSDNGQTPRISWPKCEPSTASCASGKRCVSP